MPCWPSLRFAAVILLLLGVGASGTGVFAHLHRAQYAIDEHCHQHDAGHDDSDGTVAELSAADADHDAHCQVCLDLLFRVAFADAAPPADVWHIVATAVSSLASQVFVVVAPVHIESTGPPAC